jgi:phage replication-related protein YjqB (UPF0714/DUF867 family)
MMDTYSSFAELSRNEQDGVDFTILFRQRNSRFAIIAPHGGGIEPGTVDIADALAGSEFSFYAFKGTKKSGNTVLHLTSNRFDEPVGLTIAGNAAIVISIHGSRDRGDTILIGGRHRELKQRLLEALRSAGFTAEISESAGLRGQDPANICNHGTSGEGVQLEIARGLREKMFAHLCHRPLRKRTPIFGVFVASIRTVLSLSR